MTRSAYVQGWLSLENRDNLTFAQAADLLGFDRERFRGALKSARRHGTIDLPLREKGRRRLVGLAEDVAFLREMHPGWSNAQIAARLGCSTRSIQRLPKEGVAASE